MTFALSLPRFIVCTGLLSLACACSNKPSPDPPPLASAASPSPASASATPIASATANPATTSTGSNEGPPEATAGTPLFVQAQLVDCEGEGPMKCMLVRDSPTKEWELFYDSIEGFTFEPGFTYELRVTIGNVDNPPEDGSSLKYRLVKVVAKNAASPKKP